MVKHCDDVQHEVRMGFIFDPPADGVQLAVFGKIVDKPLVAGDEYTFGFGRVPVERTAPHLEREDIQIAMLYFGGPVLVEHLGGAKGVREIMRQEGFVLLSQYTNDGIEIYKTQEPIGA